MSELIYVIRGYQFGYNDECLYVEGNRIESMFPDKQQAEAAYKKLEIKAARGFSLSDVESIFESEKSFLTTLDQFVVDTCGEHILEGDYIKYGTTIPKKMKDDDVLTFVKMAQMQSYQLLAFDSNEKLYAIWLPKEKTYAIESSEDLGSLIYEKSKQDLQSHISELIDYEDWSPTIIRGKLTELSPSPVLLEHVIKREKSVYYSEEKQTLTISGSKASTYITINQFLSKPLFEIKEFSIHEIEAIEKQLAHEYMKEFEYYDDDTDEEESKNLGPELEEADLAALRKQCSIVLENKDANVKNYIEGFTPICNELVLLEDKFTSGNEIYNENAVELLKLYKNHANELEGDQLHAYFCGYYQGVIEYLHQEQGMGSLIQRFDEAYNFSSILNELFSTDKEASDVLIESISSQDDFNAWKNYILLLAETEA